MDLGREKEEEENMKKMKDKNYPEKKRETLVKCLSVWAWVWVWVSANHANEMNDSFRFVSFSLNFAYDLDSVWILCFALARSRSSTMPAKIIVFVSFFSSVVFEILDFTECECVCAIEGVWECCVPSNLANIINSHELTTPHYSYLFTVNVFFSRVSLMMLPQHHTMTATHTNSPILCCTILWLSDFFLVSSKYENSR